MDPWWPECHLLKVWGTCHSELMIIPFWLVPWVIVHSILFSSMSLLEGPHFHGPVIIWLGSTSWQGTMILVNYKVYWSKNWVDWSVYGGWKVYSDWIYSYLEIILCLPIQQSFVYRFTGFRWDSNLDKRFMVNRTWTQTFWCRFGVEQPLNLNPRCGAGLDQVQKVHGPDCGNINLSTISWLLPWHDC